MGPVPAPPLTEISGKRSSRELQAVWAPRNLDSTIWSLAFICHLPNLRSVFGGIEQPQFLRRLPMHAPLCNQRLSTASRLHNADRRSMLPGLLHSQLVAFGLWTRFDG